MIEELLLKKGIDEEKAAKMESYAWKLVEANKTMNLTRITEPEEMAEKHFLDSILPCTLGLIAPGQSIVDVGTGAGFPGVPLAIMEPEAHFTLMDSVQKKLEVFRGLWRFAIRRMYASSSFFSGLSFFLL